MSRFQKKSFAIAMAVAVMLLSALPVRAATCETQAVVDLVRLALTFTDASQRDSMLFDGARRFTCTESFLEIVRACYYNSTKINVLKLGAERATTLEDIITLGRTSPDAQVRDQILTRGLAFCHVPDHYLTLQASCYYNSTKIEILRRGAGDCRSAYDFVAIAKTSPDAQVRDQILTQGGGRVAGVDEFLTLVAACYYNSTKINLLRMAVRDVRSLDDVIRVGRTSPDAQVRDEILLRGVEFCRSVTDAQQLASNAYYNSTKNEIVRRYGQMNNFKTLHGA